LSFLLIISFLTDFMNFLIFSAPECFFQKYALQYHVLQPASTVSGKLRQEDIFSPGVQGQPGQQIETKSLKRKKRNTNHKCTVFQCMNGFFHLINSDFFLKLGSGLKLVPLPSQPPTYLDYKYVSLCLT
jgi:hypothetical protein